MYHPGGTKKVHKNPFLPYLPMGQENKTANLEELATKCSFPHLSGVAGNLCTSIILVNPL